MTETAVSLLSRMLNDKFDKKYLAKLRVNVLEPDEDRVIGHTDVSQCASMISTLANQAERLLTRMKIGRKSCSSWRRRPTISKIE